MTHDIERWIELYAEENSVHKVAAIVGVNHSTVHKHLTRAGVMKSVNVFSEEEKDRLRREYTTYRDAGKLADLAEAMGRAKHFIARQAGELGLTDQKVKKAWLGKWTNMTYEEAEVLWDDFRASSYGLGQYLTDRGLDDLGFRRTMKIHFGDEWDAIIEGKANRSTMYRLGRQVEYSVRDKLKAAGYVVMRSPGSRSPIDLLAVAPGLVLFIQCKRGGALPVGEWNALMDMAESVGAIPVLASRPVPRRYEFFRLDERKDGSKRRQPMTPITLWGDDGPGVFEVA